MELNKKTIKTVFLGVAGCIVLYWLLHETQRMTALLKGGISILAPFIAGAVVAFILNVPMRAVEGWLKGVKNAGFRRALAMIITILLVILVLIGVFYLLIPQIINTVESLVDTLPDFFNRVYNQAMAFLADHPEAMQWLSDNTDFEKLDWAGLVQKAISLITGSLTAIADKTLQLVLGLSACIFNAVLSIVFALYCLAKKETLARQARRLLYAILPEKAADEVVRILRMSNATFANFISGQCLDACILASMVALVMAVLNFPFIPLVFVLVAVTALIPMVGAVVGCVLSALFILMVDPFKAIWFVVLFIAVQQVDNNLIYPRVVGSSIGLPSMWVLAAVTIGGSIMGVFGMLVMIPLVSVIHQLLREAAMRRLERKGTPKEKLATPEEEFLSVRQMKRQGKTVFRKREPDESGEAQEENGKPC